MSLNEVPTEVLISPDFWYVPYPRNPYFTGRTNLLSRLRDMLKSGKKAALMQPRAISGLGGIGKTQTAIEYAYRYSYEYKAVLWIKADSYEVLISDFINVANLLKLPLKDEKDQNYIVNAVKHWLQTNKAWLLIFDNIEDLEMLNSILPMANAGHILLTTQSQATGTLAWPIGIEKMGREHGATFLLRRAKIIEPDAQLDDASAFDRAKAAEISETLDGLPLALDQAGAYIEENRYDLTRYLELYHTRRNDLLKRRGGFTSGHPESVTTTFALSFEKIQRANPPASDLLCLFAFLHPDDIPEEVLTEGASGFGDCLESVVIDPIKLNEVLGELLKYSLIKRDIEARTISIHRLVQVVIKSGLDEQDQRAWALRSVKAVNQALRRITIDKILQHILFCEQLIEQWNIDFLEAPRLHMFLSNYVH